MNDNLPTNVQFDATQNGSVTFASDVVATIAGLAATEVEGVASMSGSTGLADILSRKAQTRNLTRGVKVDISENHTVAVNVTIVVEFGSPVPEVAYNIQENVKKAIETMSGMAVTGVDVHVQGVSFDRENKAAAEIEMQQHKMLSKDEAEKAEETGSEAQPVQQEEDDDDFELILDDDDEEEPNDTEKTPPEDTE